MTSNGETVKPGMIFEALSDPQREAILKALRRRKEMSFTELMKTIDAPSGRLAFQLSKLSSLLEKTEEKYRLSSLGHGALEIFDAAETLLCSPDEHEYRTGIIVRKANSDDAQAIAEVTWSWVEKWYKNKLGKIVEASLEELTSDEIEAQAGGYSIPENLRTGIRDAPIRKEALYVVTVKGMLVGFIDFPFGCIEEPKSWGRRLFGLINIHKEYTNVDVALTLLQRAKEAALGLHAEYVEILPLVQSSKLLKSIESALDKFIGTRKIDYSYLRARVDEISTDYDATVQKGTEDTLLFQRLMRNRPITWANQFSHSAREDYKVEPEKGHMLITVNGKTCALTFYDEFIPNEASLELHSESEDWANKYFIQEATKAGTEIARKQGYTKIEIIVEKAYEPWFKELGFKKWEPQTEYEQLTSKSHEGHFWEKGPNYLLEVQRSTL